MRSLRTLAGQCLALALLLTCAVWSPRILAQSTYGSITGTVTDASGAAVTDSSVTVTNLGTNETRVQKTDAAGNYHVVNLPPANYRVTVEAPSFKRLVQENVQVQVDQATRVDAALQVGSVTETVEVTTAPPLLETESGTLGSQVEGKTVEEMPLNGRNVTNLIALAPGVVPQGASMGNTTMNQGTHTNNAGWGNFQIGGSLSGQGSMYLDGAPLSTFFSHDVAFVPTQDAVQQFKVGTNSVSAQFGRFAGGVVEMSTKSGTNSFHGTAYEFLRNTVLNANTWGATSKQKWIQNQYGAAIGGPVWRNKAFFFFSWERFSSRTANLDVGNVPDTGMLAATNPSVPGNVLATIAASPNTLGLPAAQAGCLSYNPATNRTTIATACLDPTSQVIKSYFAPPTNSNSVGSPAGNYSYLVPLGDNNQQFNARGDMNFGKQLIFMRYSYLNTSDISSQDMQNHAGFMTGGSVSVYPTHQAAIGDTVTFSPTSILDSRLSMTRAYSNDGPPSAGANLGTLGFGSNWAAINAQQTIPLLPTVTWNGGLNLWPFRGFEIVDNRYADSYALTSSLTKIKGNHTLRFGGEIALFDVNGTPQFNPGSLTVNNTNFSGNEWANFLLGDITNFAFSKAIRTSSYNWYQGYFGEDTWNATHKLTVTAGLRWELPGSVSERKNRATVLLPNATQTVNGAPVNGILALVNSSAWPQRGVEPNRYDLLSPRLGAAYRFTDSTVLRAGYALVYLPIELNSGVLPLGSPVNLATTNTQNSGNNPVYTVSNPLGVGTSGQVNIIQPSGNSNPNFLANYAGQSPSSPVPSSKFPYMQQWNVTVGQQFKGQQSLQISYAGATGIHLPEAGNWNLNELSSSSAQAYATGALTKAQAQALRPHPFYNNLYDSNHWSGTETYNALQTMYTKRLGTGLLTSAYTWQKSIGDVETQLGFLNNGTIAGIQDYNNPRSERSILSYSIAHRSVTSYILDLPFGHGHRWGANLNPVADRVLGGWQINGITTFQTGQPLALTQNANDYSTNWGAGTIRPDAVPGCIPYTSGSAQSRLTHWFNTSCFAPAGTYQFGASSPLLNDALGDESRVDSRIHAAGIANWDFTAQKGTRVTETTNLQFRVEFFNLFNRRQFTNPNTSVSSGSSFGTTNSQANNPRQIQASMRFNF